MNTHLYEELFSQFLNGYWGAFHELLETESVKRDRLAYSLFRDVVEQHARFAAVCPPEAAAPLDVLGRLWHEVADHRVNVPDAPLTGEQVDRARRGFSALYDALLAVGQYYPAVRTRVIEGAVHATPRTPLRVDAAP